MELYVKMCFISKFSFFWFESVIFTEALILPVS